MHFYGRRCVMLCIFILGQCIGLHIKNCHELKAVTVSDNRFVINVDSVYCTVCLCISERASVYSYIHLVYFMIIKTVLLLLQATHFLLALRFFQSMGVTLPISRMS